MSVQSMTWALAQTIVTEPTARHVLLCLANYADKTGRGAFPSTNSLSEDTGLSVRTVKSKLSVLEKDGVIRRGNQAIAAAYIDRHDRRPVVYDIAMERGAANAPRDERRANEDATGCSSQPNGVQLTTERGAPVAPNPSFNHPLTTNEPYTSDFDRFWKLYPKKTKRKDAAKAWEKLSPSPELQQTMFASLAKWVVCHDWTKESGRYVPHPSTWLNGERWHDQLPVPGPRQSHHTDLDQIDLHDGLELQTDGTYRIARSKS